MTKTSLLSMLAKCFDALGLVSPMLLKMKLAVQKAWERKLSWTDELGEDLKLEFKQFLKELPMLQEVTIPRCFLSSGDSKVIEICCFADASENAYSTVCYIVSSD